MTDYEKMKHIIEEIPALIDSNVTSWSAEFTVWQTKAERFLINKYGIDSYEHKNFQKTHFSLAISTISTPNSDFVKACQRGLKITEAIFKTYLSEMEEANIEAANHTSQTYDYSSVFVVHGHDEELKQSVARIIEKQGIKAIILSEQANQGQTIIEKFESNSNVGGAICLFTADDIGRSKSEESDNNRARQNVVFETGYFIGKLGRGHIVILADNGVEIPSDLSGVVYTDTSHWHTDLLKELKMMGYTIDFNKQFG